MKKPTSPDEAKIAALEAEVANLKEYILIERRVPKTVLQLSKLPSLI